MKVYKHPKEGLELEGSRPQEGHVQGKNRTEELESSGLKGGTEHTPRESVVRIRDETKKTMLIRKKEATINCR